LEDLVRATFCSLWGAGWPDWANFRTMGDFLFLAVFNKLLKQPTKLGFFFSKA
jgi:hypothetical protein